VLVISGISGIRGRNTCHPAYCVGNLFEIVQYFFIGMAAIFFMGDSVNDFDVKIDCIEIWIQHVINLFRSKYPQFPEV